jgi:hypothetical protein
VEPSAQSHHSIGKFALLGKQFTVLPDHDTSFVHAYPLRGHRLGFRRCWSRIVCAAEWAAWLWPLKND